MRGYVVRTELTLAGRGIKLNGMQGGIGKSLFTVHWDESIFEIAISTFGKAKLFQEATFFIIIFTYLK